MLNTELIAPEKPRPLKRIEYERLAELGYFEDEKVELLRGVVVTMSPQGSRHSWVIERLNMLFAPALVGRAMVRVQLPLAASDDSEPEPDFAVVRRPSSPDAHPCTAALVVEVADSSARKDREIKPAIYAEAAVREYWVVDLRRGVVDVYRDASEGTYRQVTTHERPEVISPEAFPDVSVALDEILP